MTTLAIRNKLRQSKFINFIWYDLGLDNAGHGGVAASMDTETGIIITDGIDKMLNRYTEHPDSKVKYKGFQIPGWEELLKTAEAAHRMIPQHIYIGWDLALTEKGWVVVEGNDRGMLIGFQLPIHRGFRDDEIYRKLK